MDLPEAMRKRGRQTDRQTDRQTERPTPLSHNDTLRGIYLQHFKKMSNFNKIKTFVKASFIFWQRKKNKHCNVAHSSNLTCGVLSVLNDPDTHTGRPPQWVFSPGVRLQVVVASGQVGVVDLVPLHGPQEHAGLACLLGQAVVDVCEDGERGALWVAEAYVDPVIPGNRAGSLNHSFRTVR